MHDQDYRRRHDIGQNLIFDRRPVAALNQLADALRRRRFGRDRTGGCILGQMHALGAHRGRIAQVDPAGAQADLRSQIWPIVLEMIQRYFPAGTGFGTFDPVFRIGEPDGLLNPQYINLAHNDWLQLFLEGGLVAVIAIAAVLVWYLLMSLRAWSVGDANRGSRVLDKVGTILIALILAASVTDYPSRTHMVMAVLMLASVWLIAPGSKKADIGLTQPSSS